MTEPDMTGATSARVRRHRGGVRDLRQAVIVQGPDALGFLQGQLSQDVERLAPSETAWSLLLQPQGKISAWVRVTRTEHAEFVLDVDAGWAEPVVERLNRFKLRTDCDISIAPWRSITVVGPTAADAEIGGVEFEVLGHWAGLPTRDVFGSRLTISDDELVPPAAVEAVRIEAGVPRMGAELDESTIPASAGIVEQSVSFTKGCYTGQELVARIDSRGSNVPRRLVGLRLDAGTTAERGTQLTAPDGDKAVGSITSVGRSDDVGATVALAYATRQVEIGDTVSVGDGSAQVLELPLVRA